MEPGFDGCLREFGEKTERVLDFGCGTGDILFQYIQEFPKHRGVGIDGVILSNVLDVMPEQIDETVLQKLNRVLKTGGFWFIKLNPYYTAKELKSFDYEKENGHLYEENGILRLHQETTNHWKQIFAKYGSIERYMEFVYPWQEGLNRLFLMKKK